LDLVWTNRLQGNLMNCFRLVSAAFTLLFACFVMYLILFVSELI